MIMFFNRWSVTAEAHVKSQVCPCAIFAGQISLEQVLLRIVLLSHIIIIMPPMFLTHVLSITHVVDRVVSLISIVPLVIKIKLQAVIVFSIAHFYY